jgi:hypothetical protein
MVNNLIYDREQMDLDLQSEGYHVVKNSIVGNVFMRGPSYKRITHPIYVHTSGSYKLGSGSRVYVKDNREPGYAGSTYSELVTLNGGDIISGLMTQVTRPVWNSGLVVLPSSNSEVYSHVLSYAGARPTDRDTVDKRIVLNVRRGEGGVINCVASNGTTRCKKNGGGWPSYAYNRRTLTLPSSPSSIASNGYSNLENWLNSQDRSINLNGVVDPSSPAASPSLSVQ